MGLLSSLPFHPSVRPAHALTYVLAVPLFSISFLVFLNSSLSFLLTNRFSTPASQLGSIVGTLGFTDELVALFATVFWGLLSDGSIGTRGVATAGYLFITIGLVMFVTVPTVYPGLIFARIVFALGAAAVTTMVSAILPEMTSPSPSASSSEAGEKKPTGRLAGLVGLFTGLGALLALGLFLPLPTRFSENPKFSPANAVEISFLIVAAISLVVSVWCLVGLPPPRYVPRVTTWQRIKAFCWVRIWGGDPRYMEVDSDSEEGRTSEDAPSGVHGLWAAMKAGFQDSRIGIAYIGGFVARAASVGISLFIPLYVNHFFVSSGLCSPTIPELTKEECKKAYIVASELTGTTQLIALLLAPGFGVLTDRCARTRGWASAPLVLSGCLGIVGFVGFSKTGDPRKGMAFVWGALMGASQIGAIVASLGLMSRGIVDYTPKASSTTSERDPLLPNEAGTNGNSVPAKPAPSGREAFKGSIAGVYSLAGAAAILILTKGGGAAFDKLSSGAPFWFLAGVNGLLVLAAGGQMIWSWVAGMGRGRGGEM